MKDWFINQHLDTHHNGTLFDVWMVLNLFLIGVVLLFGGCAYVADGVTPGLIRALHVAGVVLVFTQTPLVINALGSHFNNQEKRKEKYKDDLV